MSHKNNIQNVLCTLAQMQTMYNHTERCCISDYYGASLMHNKAKELIGKEENYLALISSDVVSSSFLNSY